MRRWLTRIALLLALASAGAILNVAVAWTFVNYPHLSGAREDEHQVAEARMRAYFGQWNQPVYFDQCTRRGVGHTRIRALATQYERVGIEIEIIHQDVLWVDTAGWPVQSLRGQLLMTNGEVDKERSSAFFERGEPASEQWRIFPTTAVWPGFAINTVFYAVILWLFFAAPGSVRRRIRARRGQCPACAYPVGSSDVCTECGEPVTPRSAKVYHARSMTFCWRQWVIVPITTLALHTTLVLFVDWDRKQGPTTLEYIVPFLDFIPTAIAISRDSSGPEFNGILLIGGNLQWLAIACSICGLNAMRGKHRLERGLCPACAYPIGTSDVCTECGRPLR